MRKRNTFYPGTKKGMTSKEALQGAIATLLVVSLVALGFFALMFTGVFTPVQAASGLVETPEDALPITAMPSYDPSASGQGTVAERLIGTEPKMVLTASSTVRTERKSGISDEQREEIKQEVYDHNMEIYSTITDPWDEDAMLSLIQDQPDFFVPSEHRVTVKKNDLNLHKNLPEEWINVLLLGSDERDANSDEGRTDVMIVVSVNTQTGALKMSSIARDLYVEMPNLVGYNKINTAHAYGGPNLAMKAVNTLFDLNIQYYASVNLHGLAEIIELFGGVDIDLQPGEAEWINYNVAVSEDYEGFEKSERRVTLAKDQVGLTRLDGLQAVAYARIRYLDSDLGRNNRQRILLSNLLDMIAVDATPQKVLLMANVIVPYTSTNIPLSEIVRIGTAVLKVGIGDLESFSVPVEGSFQYQQVEESSVLQANIETNKKALHTFIFGEHIPRSE